MKGIERIEWTEEYESGNAAIDVQHKYLFSIINQLSYAIEAGCDKKAIGQTIEQIEHYTKWHFCREEECMAATNGLCPVGEKTNKEQHAKLLEAIPALKKEFTDSDEPNIVALKLYRTLIMWVANHIKKTDIPCLTAKSSKE